MVLYQVDQITNKNSIDHLTSSYCPIVPPLILPIVIDPQVPLGPIPSHHYHLTTRLPSHRPHHSIQLQLLYHLLSYIQITDVQLTPLIAKRNIDLTRRRRHCSIYIIELVVYNPESGVNLSTSFYLFPEDIAIISAVEEVVLFELVLKVVDGIGCSCKVGVN